MSIVTTKFLDRFETALVSVIVLVSVGIALIWMFQIPAFQSADEDVHFDYALSIATTHRLISSKEGRPGIDVHPTVTYLQDATGFHSILYNLTGRVSHDYGTAAYYRRIDISAPVVPSDFIAREKRIPYLLIYYPFGYYALDALVIEAGNLITHGSAIGSLFFARSFSVALLSCSLILIYLILAEMRVAIAQRLLILAIIGTFPLTSWVSAYVQPDNLAVTSVLLSLYVTLRLRRSPGDTRTFLALGSSLALLLLTKVHYFAAVAPVAIAAAITYPGSRRASVKYWLTFLLCVGVPLVLAFEAERLVADGPIGSSAAYLDFLGADFHDALQSGPRQFASYVAVKAFDAYRSMFFDGGSLQTYWGAFGFHPYPIVIGTLSFTLLLWRFIGIVSVVIGMGLAVRTADILRRLASVARRSRSRALSLLLGDPVLNSYIVFASIMIALFVYSAGRSASWGRYWIPFETSAVLCATWYVPRSIPRKLTAPSAKLMTAALLIYSLVSSICGIISLRARFYDPPKVLSIWESDAGIASVNGIPVFIAADGSTPDLRFRQASRITIRGGAIDSRAGETAKGVDFLIDGHFAGHAKYGLPIPGLLGFHDPRLLASGFAGSVDLRGLRPGKHSLRLQVYEHNRVSPYPSKQVLELEILPNDDR